MNNNCIDREHLAVALGLFDGLHVGHTEVIKQVLNQEGLIPAVFTFTDETLLPKMQRRENIISYEQKIRLLKAMGIREIHALDFGEAKNLSPEEFVLRILQDRLNARYVSCGYDFHFGKQGAGNAATLKQLCAPHGIKVYVAPVVTVNNKPVSSTEIRNLIKSGDIKTANKMLGYELMYDLEVMHGAKLGRQLEAPTINQIIPDGNVIPLFGVYQSWVSFDEKQYSGITNIGIKPTVNSDTKPLMETHIIGYNGDLDVGLYGKTVRVALVDFIRAERRFDNIFQLKSQIQTDINYVSNKRQHGGIL